MYDEYSITPEEWALIELVRKQYGEGLERAQNEAAQARRTASRFEAIEHERDAIKAKYDALAKAWRNTEKFQLIQKIKGLQRDAKFRPPRDLKYERCRKDLAQAKLNAETAERMMRQAMAERDALRRELDEYTQARQDASEYTERIMEQAKAESAAPRKGKANEQ